LLANSPATMEAIPVLRSLPQCSFGVHLNITEYEPLTKAPGLAGLLDQEGKLRRLPVGFRFSMAMLRAIYTEFSAQIEKLTSKGVPISHMDSHMHLHLRPALFPVMKALQRTYGIRKIRRRENLTNSIEPAAFRTRLRRFAYDWAIRHTCNSLTTDAMSDLTTLISVGSRQPLDFRTVEALVHPGNPFYPGDIQLLLSPWEKELCFPVRFVSYHQVC
jgi:predicted glycoside hydrolase/deacetylase ChbG (UPF0249 family)